MTPRTIRTLRRVSRRQRPRRPRNRGLRLPLHVADEVLQRGEDVLIGLVLLHDGGGDVRGRAGFRRAPVVGAECLSLLSRKPTTNCFFSAPSVPMIWRIAALYPPSRTPRPPGRCHRCR